MQWRRPADVLAEFASGATLLQPPQLYELSRLQRFQTWSQLERFSRERAPRGTDRLMPVVTLLSDGTPRQPDAR